LPPAKAAILLRLALTITNDPVKIQEMFEISST
jgi:L-asparaginase/Glu-tRNA(Gln) amidotransferase subunit D